jgi:hypothetical protein
MEVVMRIRRKIIQSPAVGEKGVDHRPAARDYSSSAVILSGLIGYRAVGGPWWAEFALMALAMLAVVLRIVFPQDSPDKLAWWRDRRLTRQRESREASEPERLPSEGSKATRP